MEEEDEEEEDDVAPAPLPKPPAGFVLDPDGNVLMASSKRTVSIVSNFCELVLTRQDGCWIVDVPTQSLISSELLIPNSVVLTPEPIGMVQE